MENEDSSFKKSKSQQTRRVRGSKRRQIFLLNRLRPDNSNKKLVFFKLNDSELERQWSSALESWGIGCVSILCQDELVACLHETQLIVFGANRVDLSALASVLMSSLHSPIPLLAVGCGLEINQKVRLLESGVEDCIEKTCTAREFVARVRAILRRCEITPGQMSVRSVSGWTIDLSSREVRPPNGLPVILSKAELNLMRIFVQFPDRIFSLNELSEAAFVDSSRRSESGLMRIIRRLRVRLEATHSRSYMIQTIQHKGYRLTREMELGSEAKMVCQE